ncbi:MAG TPA: hypothetical protein VNF91_11240, partial [Candidatus Acidoferrum sp.]|nr:hypothetical protein [Candidatus Acidoferrum sp.]
VEKGPIEALRNLLKARGIAGSDDEWKDEAAELITDLSEKVFGTKIDPTLRNTIDVRRAKRANSLTRKQLTDREQALERQRLEAKAESEWTSARTALAGELGKPEHRSAYNFLSALDNPAQVVMEWVQKEAQAGRSVTWQEAAKAANDYIHDQVAQHDKRWRPLLEKVSTPKQPPQAAPGRPPGTSQVTQPKPPPQQVQPPPKPQTSGRDWNETNRKETKRKMRAAFRQGQ